MTRRITRVPATRSWQRLGRDALDVGTAAPQVIGQRLTQLAFGGPWFLPAQQMEIWRMTSEKVLAAQQATLAMAMAGAQAMASTWWSPRGVSPAALFAAWPRVLDAGVAPVRATVRANARRLGRSAKARKGARAR